MLIGRDRTFFLSRAKLLIRKLLTGKNAPYCLPEHGIVQFVGLFINKELFGVRLLIKPLISWVVTCTKKDGNKELQLEKKCI